MTAWTFQIGLIIRKISNVSVFYGPGYCIITADINSVIQQIYLASSNILHYLYSQFYWYINRSHRFTSRLAGETGKIRLSGLSFWGGEIIIWPAKKCIYLVIKVIPLRWLRGTDRKDSKRKGRDRKSSEGGGVWIIWSNSWILASLNSW